MGCADTQFVSGGVVKEATVLNSQVTNSVIEGSVIRGSSLENLTSIDAASTAKIVEQMAQLDPAVLSALAAKLAQSGQLAPTPPASSNDTSVPTRMVGARDTSLGRPDAWGKFSDTHIVPLYTPAVQP